MAYSVTSVIWRTMRDSFRTALSHWRLLAQYYKASNTTVVDRIAGTIDFNRLDQYSTIAGHATYSYAELIVSSLALVQSKTMTHCPYPWRDDQLELTWRAVAFCLSLTLCSARIIIIIIILYYAIYGSTQAHKHKQLTAKIHQNYI